MRKLLLYVFRRAFVFANVRRPIKPFHINLLWYDKMVDGKYNVGDFLSVVVARYLLERKGIKVFPHKTMRLSVIGSVIQFISAPTTVFGSGFLDRRSIEIFRRKKPRLKLLAVRGPLTLSALASMGYDVSDTVLGDPALLLPLVYTPQIRIKRYDYVVIPHYSKLGQFGGQSCPLYFDS